MSLFLFQILIFSIFVIFAGSIGTICLYIIKKKGNPLPKLFYEFDKKIWMTCGLGIIFFGSYLIFVGVLAQLLPSDKSKQVVSFFQQYKVESIYTGLLIFSLTTSIIYLARLFIKCLYAKKAKNK